MSFSISPFNEYSGFISFRMDWLDLLTVQGTLKSLLQHQVQKHQFCRPVSTREEARESRPHSEESRFRLLSREEGSFPCVLGKEFPAFPSHLKSRCSQQEREEELQGRATIPRVPQMSQSTQGKPVFPALPRLSSQGSTHSTVARGILMCMCEI